MGLFNKKKILVTHNGAFHADDLFATAALSILNKGNIKIIRTRDLETKGDYIYDIMGQYDPDNDIFDHHQKGGAGVRDNGIPYAAFGLVWEKYGEQICGSKEVAQKIDKKVVQPIDAKDNGVDVSESIFPGIKEYSAQHFFLNYCPTWKEDDINVDKIFKKQVKEAIKALKREIKVAQDDVEGEKIIMNAYNNIEDKRIVIINQFFPRYLIQNTLSTLEEPIYIIYPSRHSDLWKVEAVKKTPTTMESRKAFPEEWRGSVGDEEKLKKITGDPEIIFCHNSGFLIVTETKESAIKLANKSLCL
ncbi:MAG: MYG1 family protein [Patescibacteria group bacterium]|nr:MYG1 family protein [Patescibacteria group bacterium]